MEKTNPFVQTKTIVDNLKGIAKDLKGSKIESVAIPLPALSNETYPLGIMPGFYSKENLAEAIQFLADMIEE